MKNTTLSPRLTSVSSFVLQGAVLADIGTDHARVPIYLIKNGTVPRAIASDVREGPLKKALENIEFFGLSDKIELRLGNGMQTLGNNDAECIVIAGMGGELMATLLSDYIPSGAQRLVLQPMIDPHLVRAALCRVGYRIIAEDIIAENGKMYNVIVAEKGDMSLSREQLFVPPHIKEHPLYNDFLAYRFERIRFAAENAVKAGAGNHLTEEYYILKKFLA